MDEVRRLALHEIHAAAGAAFRTARGWVLPACYAGGDGEAVAREYGAAREGAAVVDLSDRGVLAVAGPLRQKFLDNILSNDVSVHGPGEGCLAALMDAKGHILSFLRVLVGKDAVLLEAPADRMKLLEDTLLHYRVAAPVRFEVRPTVVLGLLGPRARDSLARAGSLTTGLGPEGHATGSIGGKAILLARATDLPCGGFVIHAPPKEAAPVWDAFCSAGALPLGRNALDALRVESGRAWYGPDVTEENLLHETGLLSAYHSSTKGCYIGQEVVARLEARGGHVNKLLRGLVLGSPVSPGAAVLAEGKEVGRVTTAAVSPRLGPIALAYIHRSCFEAGTAVEVEGVPATVERLPLTGGET